MDWQLTASLVIVLLAGGYLARRGWLLFSRKKTGGCGSCSTGAVKNDGVVSLSVDRVTKQGAEVG